MKNISKTNDKNTGNCKSWILRISVFALLIGTLHFTSCSNLDSTDPADVQGVDWADVEQSSSGVAPVLSSSAVVSSSESISSSGTSVSTIPEGAFLIYDAATMGDTLATGGGLQIEGEQGDESFNYYTCNGVRSSTDTQPGNFAYLCIDNQVVDILFEIEYSSDGENNWGYAQVIADFLPGQLDVPSNKQAYDLSAYSGVCVTYNSTAPLFFQINTTLDRDGDSYKATLPANSSLQKSCTSFSSFEKEAWSFDFDFNLSEATGITLTIDESGEYRLRFSEIYFYQ